MNPPGVQLASPIRPPGRHTRASSAAARAWSGANITPKAGEVGYRTDTALSRAFRREYGVPPAAWRWSHAVREQAVG